MGEGLKYQELGNYWAQRDEVAMAGPPGRVTVEIEEAKQELVLLLTRLDEKTTQERDSVTKVDLIKHYEQQQAAQHEALEKIEFLKLPDPDTFGETFRGDVMFIVHATIPKLIYAHRFILAGRSSVFKRMFEVGMVEEHTGRIKISDASYATMRAVVNYCYTAELEFSDSVQPEEVLKVAHKYDIAPLRRLCEAELCKRITAKNLPDMLRLSRTYEAAGLQRESMKFFKQHFDTVQDTVLENLLPNWSNARPCAPETTHTHGSDGFHQP